MRGRLIFPFLAEVCRLDTRATAEAEPGYDPDFSELALSYVESRSDEGEGRREHPPVRLPCQVEPKAFEELRLFASGNSPKTQMDLIFHFKDLEERGLVDPVTGEALLRPGDRLAALCDIRGELVQSIRTPPGLYATEVLPLCFGLGWVRPRRNLLRVSFGDRPLAARRGA